MGMEHHLGLTCDPVNGLVQIPCMERNGFAATRAMDAAEFALLHDGRHKISFDEVILTMKLTGKDLNDRYRETAGGGLAVTYSLDEHQAQRNRQEDMIKEATEMLTDAAASVPRTPSELALRSPTTGAAQASPTTPSRPRLHSRSPPLAPNRHRTHPSTRFRTPVQVVSRARLPAIPGHPAVATTLPHGPANPAAVPSMQRRWIILLVRHEHVFDQNRKSAAQKNNKSGNKIAGHAHSTQDSIRTIGCESAPVETPVEAPATEAAPAAPMNEVTALQEVLKRAVIGNGIVRGLREVARCLDRRQAHLCILARNCDEPAYVKLVEALCTEHSIPLIKVDDNKDLGQWVGLCKIDKEGKARKIVACSCCAVRDYCTQDNTEAFEYLQNYIKTVKAE
ncbi:putative 40S ribosomal protein [Paratrimastix pyriformis]|uniref:40S ribosomal protein S12 n=1 Tax=Paratrimastix pyriformis TaxID=342808 RepID=A0ABQ8UL29_9EUKA|nr:putative 40S ribosomal protein [Paratrimastix pyriformis]